MHPIESPNHVNEIAVNQDVSTLECALALTPGKNKAPENQGL
jgi:hypothetical protein